MSSASTGYSQQISTGGLPPPLALGQMQLMNIDLKRSVDGGLSTVGFDPTPDEFSERMREFRSQGSDYDIAFAETDWSTYISRSDWDDIGKLFASRTNDVTASEELRLVTSLFVEARAESETYAGNYAFVLATTTLELALNFYIRQRSHKSKALAVSLQQLRTLSLPSKFASVAIHLRLSTGDIDLTLEAIKIRNAIVHEGKDVPENPAPAIQAILRSISSLLPMDVRLTKYPETYY